MASEEFVPPGFVPPSTLVTDRFRLVPLGPEHNEADLAAWMSSVEHIRSTPGYPDGSWPPPEGLSPERNLADLERHAQDFAANRGFTFTVLDPAAEVIGCVYLYPPDTPDFDVSVQSWVRPATPSWTLPWRTRSRSGSLPSGRGRSQTATGAEGASTGGGAGRSG